VIKRPPLPSKLIWDDDWLKAFCTYSQKQAILLWAYKKGDLKPHRREISSLIESR
jgi:hypothetical protein